MNDAFFDAAMIGFIYLTLATFWADRGHKVTAVLSLVTAAGLFLIAALRFGAVA